MMRILILLALLVAGCATRTPAPVDDRRPAVPAPPIAPMPMPMPPPPGSPQAMPELPPPAPAKDWRPETYTVKRGDTLFAVALEHGLDYRELAAMNNLENVNVIRVGQVLRVRPPGDPAADGAGLTTAPLVSVPPVTDARPVPAPPAAAAAAPAVTPRPPTERGNTDTYKSQPKAVKVPYSDAALAQMQAAVPATVPAPVAAAVVAPPAPPPPLATAAPSPPLATAAPAVAAAVPASPSVGPPLPPAAADTSDDRVDWSWPVRGRIISGYSESASLKGIDIGGAAGLPILASAPGKVVYAGSGLRGYGKLVIVKHNKTYLSAYAHLDQISIREGQMVTKGQELGKMGNTDADQVKLHFEIRSLGKPVDPLRYLPRG
ncbi:MAG: peptidoglycan DD-metalloendopeptidase family protein [Betaproteobacteria bacterium]|nr:peptidoglycan DD-metalloendopeptidase family protein [Betaproteobacteria bacterium]